jgi:hypothetical protein
MSCLKTFAVAFAGVIASDDQMLLQADVVPLGGDAPKLEDSIEEPTGELSSLLAQPAGVIEEMTTKVTALTKKMAEMKRVNEIKMTSQADMFKKRLQDVAANTTAIAHENTALKAEIDALVNGNAEKREKARELGKVNAEMLLELKSARVMIETAAEFVDKSISDNDDVGVEDLKVLSELDEEDANSAAAATHQGRLDEVANARKPPLQMLDLGASPSKTMPAGDLVGGLEAGLEMFAQEAKKSEELLKARFLEDFKQASLRQAQLLKDQSSLKTQKQMLKTLQARLAAAVAHLEATHANLVEKVQSVQGFAKGSLGNLNKALESANK